MPRNDKSAAGADRDYEVGYGKPPQHSRWSKGQSGNPKGRQKGVKNFRTEVLEVLKTPVAVVEDGKQKKVTGTRAALMRLLQRALGGDIRAIDAYLKLGALYGDDPINAVRPMTEDDRLILDRFVARKQRVPGATLAPPSAAGAATESNDE